MLFSIWSAVALGLLVVLALWWVLSPKTPPGPLGFPIVGYLPFLSKLPHLDLQRLGKRYGNVYSLRLGSRFVVVLNDFKSAKEAFAQDAFMGRPPEIPFDVNQTTIETGAFFGLPWKDQRRFSLHMLRDLGLGKSKMEAHIQEEIKELLEHFEENSNKPFCVRELLAPSMSNNVGALMFGKRFKYDDPVRQMLNEAVLAIASGAQQIGWMIFFPWVKKTLTFLGIGNFRTSDINSRKLYDFTRKEIEEHERTLNPDNIRDFIDGYLVEMRKRKDDRAFCKEVLEDVVVGFFAAGSETVRLSVEWLVLLAAEYQDGQRRIQAEIDDVVGHNRRPDWLDQKFMPYTEAFIAEMMRWQTITPLNILRYTLTDAKLNGYHIPKHTLVVSNLWAVHHDPEYWGKDADEFQPERFLTEDDKTVKKENYIPFSIGKRSCPGEPMAKVEIFLYFTAILQRFHLRMPAGKKPDFQGILGVGLMPKAQDIILTKRS